MESFNFEAQGHVVLKWHTFSSHVSVGPRPCPHFVLVGILMFTDLWKENGTSLRFLKYIFLITNEIERLLICLFAICGFPSVRCLFVSFACFPLGFKEFLKIYREYYAFDSYMCYRYFLPVFDLSFSLSLCTFFEKSHLLSYNWHNKLDIFKIPN